MKVSPAARLYFLLGLSPFAVLNVAAQQPSAAACTALKNLRNLTNTTIVDATHVNAGTSVTTPGSCGSRTTISSAVCRVQFRVATTSTSSVRAEAWLPDVWFGRFLGVGNGGLGGCIDYSNIDYGASLHFATVGSDNGHDGNSGSVFLNKPEVINDFAFRAIHVQALVGKQLVQAYYGRAQSKSYYLGCSTGGRQGFRSALDFPADYDGIVAGSPATDWNHLQSWSGALSTFLGGPNFNGKPSFVPLNLWNTIGNEILNQCDTLDGLKDGTITEPDDCQFRPEVLACSNGQTGSNCLSPAQLTAVQKVYSPLLGDRGQLLYPRFDPGAEANGGSQPLLAGPLFSFTQDWYKFTIFNDSNHNFEGFGVRDFAIADAINPGGISTFRENLSAFSSRGGKLLSYHGRRDNLIASGQSKRMYNLVSDTLGGVSVLDNFYRLFLIPGMGHCSGGGASRFGQGGIASNAVNDSSHNILLAMVDWVERGVAPGTIIGSANGGRTRTHCRFPQRSVLGSGNTFVCQP